MSAKAEVEKVLQYENYSEEQLKNIIFKHGGKEGICFINPLPEVYEWAKNKKYSILIFLKNAKKIEPFQIDKKGYGNACAWICVEDIDLLKKTKF